MDEIPNYGDEQGQDYRDPGTAPVQVAPPPPPPPPSPVMAQPVAPVAPPMPGTSAIMSPDQRVQAEFMQRAYNRARYGAPNDELALAEQAINAAVKFQAQRGFQQDLQQGKSASEALAKWAPMLFTNPKQATLGQAAAMVRATRPAAPMVRSAGGQLFQVPPGGGAATALTPPPVRQPRVDPFALREFDAKQKQIAKLQEDIELLPKEEKPKMQAQIDRLTREAQALKSSASPAVTAPGAGTRKEVIRLTKDGRRAVFDASTRTFIRYAE